MGGAGNVMLTILLKAKASNPVDCKHAIGTPQMTIGDTIEDIVAALREKAARTPLGKWVVGRGYDDTLVREQRHPTRDDLDRAIAPELVPSDLAEDF